MINQKWIQNLIWVLSTKATQPLLSIIEKFKQIILPLHKDFFLIKFLGQWVVNKVRSQKSTHPSPLPGGEIIRSCFCNGDLSKAPKTFRLQMPCSKPNYFGKFVYLLLIFIVTLGLTAATVKYPTVKIPIFGFHDIIDLQNKADLPPYRRLSDMDYTKQDLEKFIDYLVQKNYWFLSSQDLFIYFINKSQPIPTEHIGQKPVMLTFDDGYQGVHKNGLPILEKMEEKYGEKVKFVLFVNPKTLGFDNGKDLPHLSCQDLREGYQKDFYDIQSHGFTHKKLTKLSSKELDVELYFAKLALRKCTNDLDRNKIVAAHIAYPFGAINKRIERKLPKYHLTGFVYDDNFLRVNYLKNQFRISRITVGSHTSPYKLIRLASRASTLKKIKINFPSGKSKLSGGGASG